MPDLKAVDLKAAGSEGCRVWRLPAGMGSRQNGPAQTFDGAVRQNGPAQTPGTDAFTGMLRSNQTAGFIIEQLKHETTEEEIAAALFAEYDAPEDVIKRDVHAVIEKLRSIGAIDE